MLYFLLLLGYLFGSIPSGLVLANSLVGKDIRKHGSGNIGTTNAYRVGGKKLGLATLFCDMLKAFVPLLIAECLMPYDIVALCGVGFSIIVGHMFSIFINFKGGKGVATSLAVLLFITPIIALVAMIVFVSVFYKTRLVSLASLLAATASLIASVFISPYPVLCLVLAIFLLVIIKHKDNIRRLSQGIESKL